MKLFLSGAENTKAFEVLCWAKQKYILMSYLYLRKKKLGLKHFYDQANYDMRFMLDSGAHSFLETSVEHVLKKETAKYGPRDAIKSYLYDYLEFLEANKQYIDIAVELDLGPVWLYVDGETHVKEHTVGQETVTEWREKLFKPMHKSKGFDVCFVNHGEGLEELATYGDFVGTSSVHTVSGSYGKVFTTARKLNLRVHGFAVTGREIRKYPFTTVDSTSWTSGQRYGITYYLAGGSLLNLGPDQKFRRKRFKRKVIELGLDYKGFQEDKGDAIIYWNCFQWKKFADYIEKRWESRVAKTKDGGLGVNEEINEISDEELLNEDLEALSQDDTLTAEDKEDAPEQRELITIPEQKREMIQAEGIANGIDKPFEFLSCQDCYLGERCPRYIAEGKCTFSINIDMNEKGDMKEMLNNLVSIQYGRIIRGKMVEEADGGVPDKVLSGELSLLMNMLVSIKSLTEKEQDNLIIKAKGSGVIEKLFGALKGNQDKE